MKSQTLRDAIEPLATDVGVTQTAVGNLFVGRITAPSPRAPAVYAPSLCVVAQGRKRAYLGDVPFEYDPGNYLLCSLTLPIESEIVTATPHKPMLAAILKFDPALVARLLVEMEEFSDGAVEPLPPQVAVAPCRMSAPVHDALVRLLHAAADPMATRLIAAGLQRELVFEVLRGPNGQLLRNFVLRDGSAHRIARVVSHLERHYTEPLDVKDIAQQAGMSHSSLHEHFKRATSLSPIQFVKRLRLHEARAQLLAGRGASEAAFAVAYSSPSQFSREFRRMFGQAPSQLGTDKAVAS